MIPNEPVLYKNVITEDERVLLREHALNLLDNGVLHINKATPGNYRNGKSYFSLDQMPDIHINLYNKVVNLLNLENPVIDPALGNIVSVIKPGGHIQPHRDKYVDAAQVFRRPELLQFAHKRNVRFNVMVDRGDDLSYNPVINNKTFIVNKCEAWCFGASEIPHRTEKIAGPENRIVYQFGFCLDAI